MLTTLPRVWLLPQSGASLVFRTEQFARSTENEHPTPAPGKPTLPPTTDSIANLTWYIDATGIEQISPPLG